MNWTSVLWYLLLASTVVWSATAQNSPTITSAPTSTPTGQCPAVEFSLQVLNSTNGIYIIHWTQLSPVVGSPPDASYFVRNAFSVTLHLIRPRPTTTISLTSFSSNTLNEFVQWRFVFDPYDISYGFLPGDFYEFSFTYRTFQHNQVVECTTETFQYQVPGTPIQCADVVLVPRVTEAMLFSSLVPAIELNVVSNTLPLGVSVDSVAIHLTRSGETPINYFISRVNETLFQAFPFSLDSPQPGETITYSFTYHITRGYTFVIGCDTPTFTHIYPSTPTSGAGTDGPTSVPTLALSPQSCPIVSVIPHVQDIGVADGSVDRRNYKIVAAIIPPPNSAAPVVVEYIDVHILSSYEFLNYRMILSSSSPSPSPSPSPVYQLTLPLLTAWRAGEAIEYWFTISTTLNQLAIACDTITYSYTNPGTPINNPTFGPPTGSGRCPLITFQHNLQITGQGEVSGSVTGSVIFTAPSSVEWVDLHITANSGFFNYRMTSVTLSPNEHTFTQALPEPYLSLISGESVSYWFTYSSLGQQCDTETFAVIVNF